MPMTQPNKDHADENGIALTKDILIWLKLKNVDRPHPALHMGLKYGKDWDELVNKLEETIKEMVWLNYCANF